MKSLQIAVLDRHDLIKTELKKLGYYYDNNIGFSKNGLYVKTYPISNRFEFFDESRETHNTIIVDDMDVFLALSSITKDGIYKGDLYKFIGDDSTTFTNGQLYKAIRPLTEGLAFIDNSNIPNGFQGENHKKFIKPTTEEIFGYFKDKKELPMKTTEFTVEGSRFLLKALEQDLLANGYTKSFYNEGYSKLLCSKMAEKGHIDTSREKYPIHYIVPLQYGEARQAFLDALNNKQTRHYTINVNGDEKFDGDSEIIQVEITKDSIIMNYDNKINAISPYILLDLMEKVFELNRKPFGVWDISIDKINIGCKEINISDIIAIYYLYQEIAYDATPTKK